MKLHKALTTTLILAALAFYSVGCTTTQKGAAIGGVVGAGAGAVIGHNTSAGSGTGALIGAGVGALGGALAGDAIDERDEKRR